MRPRRKNLRGAVTAGARGRLRIIVHLEVSSLARRQVADLNSWWRGNRTAARHAVRDELARAFRLILAQPHIGPRALDVEIEGVRRIHLSRIRHYLYYRVFETSSIVEVLAVWSDSRGEPPPL